MNDRILIFSLQGENFALPLSQVAEVLEDPDTFPVPLAPSFLHGAINAHGALIPIVDLSTFLLDRSSLPGGTLVVLEKSMAALALSIGAVVDIVPAAEVEDEEPTDNDLTPATVLCRGRKARRLDTAQLLEQIEKALDSHLPPHGRR